MKKISNIVITLFLMVLLLSSQVSIGLKLYPRFNEKNLIENYSSFVKCFSIQSIIDHADVGDTIVIPSGTYYEKLTINKSLTIIGKKNTFFDGFYEKSIMIIDANQVTIKNVHFRNSGGYDTDSGIKIFGNDISIKQCVFYQSKQGIYLQKNCNVTIDSCLFYKLGRAIAVKQSQKVIITNCSSSYCAIGVFLNNSQTLFINHSQFDSNGITMYSKKSQDVSINHLSVKDNSDNHGGIFVEESSYVHISNSSIHHNGIGINIEDSEQIILSDLLITNNTHFGILLRDYAKEVMIQRCKIKNNFRFGVYCYDDTSAMITENMFIHNFLFGIYSSDPVHTLEQNWWGTSSGPTILANGNNDRISLSNYISHFSKWSIQPYTYTFETREHVNFYENLSIDKPDLSHFIQGIDSDSDGVPNWWEEKWGYDPNSFQNHTKLDVDNDGLTNLEECFTDQWNSNPYKKDIFIEVDWITSNTKWHSNKPSSFLLEKLVETFDQYDITLHIDDGRLGFGGQIVFQDTSDFSEMVDIYWNNFLHQDLLNPRKGIFRYAIIADICADVSYPFIGWDQFDSIAISAGEAKRLSPQYPRQIIIVGGLLHQLGSTLGLLAETHPGNDNLQVGKIGSIDWFTYRSYKSSMNYLYKYRVLSYSDGSRGNGDFNDWNSLDFSFFKTTSFD